MSYKIEYLEKIKEINSLISKEQIVNDECTKKLTDYLNSVKGLESFTIESWKKDWKKEVYTLGEFFKEIDPCGVFSTIDKIIEKGDCNKSEQEVLDFIRSEVYVNFFSPKDSIKYFKELIKKYPLNPEFKNSLGICYNRIGKFKKSADCLKEAIKLDKKNEVWLKDLYKKEYAIAEKLIQDKKHDEADRYLQDIINSKFYPNHLSEEFQNFFIFLKQRNNDQLLIENKLSTINQNSKNLIDSLFEKNQIKLIELLGFFTAIIAFVFGTITITVKLNLQASLILISAFGLIMIVFALCLSILFVKSEKKWFEDKRFWVLTLIVFLIFLIVRLGNSLVN